MRVRDGTWPFSHQDQPVFPVGRSKACWFLRASEVKLILNNSDDDSMGRGKQVELFPRGLNTKTVRRWTVKGKRPAVKGVTPIVPH